REAATAEMVWRIGDRRAEFAARAHVKAPGGRLSLVEWNVPAAVTLTDVRGPDIHRSSRAGNRLQVWLAPPAPEATIDVGGFIARHAGVSQVDLPPVRPRTATLDGTLRVAAAEGLALSAVQSANLKRLPNTGDEWSYSIDGPQAYRAVFEVASRAGSAN